MEGRLTRMDCGASFAVFHVESDGRTLRLVEPILGVQMLSYAGAGTRTIGCGAVRDAPKVLATYHDAPDDPSHEGIAVAIEFVATPDASR